MRNKVSILILLGALGCTAPTYNNRTELPAPLRERLEKIEEYYLEQVLVSASFLNDCPKEEIEASVLSRVQKRFVIKVSDAQEFGAYMEEKQISTIGVGACGNRTIYRVSCGSQESYAAIVLNRSDLSPCKIVAETSIETEKPKNEKVVNQGVELENK
jgi:hypothetical protein